MSTDPPLEVRHGARVVGSLRMIESQLAFAYAASWLADAAAFQISVSLPLAPGEVIGGPAHGFFGNLLPEGDLRRALCARLGISDTNDLALLTAIGGECAGALSIVPAGTPVPAPEAYRYERLSDARLQKLVDDESGLPQLLGGRDIRLSLAGAQDKLPVAVLDGHLHLPHGQAPSTHILKLPSRRYKHLPANECFVMGLALHAGLDAVAVELTTKTSPPSLLVPRYDRIPAAGEDWPVARQHQEDFCQVLGLPASAKYESEGGPRFTDVLAVLSRHAHVPVTDIRRAIEWQAFNIVVGNSDGHAKNLSLLYAPDGVRLAPFYDLVSTRYYEHLAKRMAMGVSGRDNGDEIGAAQWDALATAATLGKRIVRTLARDVVERVDAALDDWTSAFRKRYGRQPILERLPALIRARAKRARRNF